MADEELKDEAKKEEPKPFRRGGRPLPRRNVSEAENVAANAERVQKHEDRWQSELRGLSNQRDFQRYLWRWMDKLKMWSDAIPREANDLYVQAAEKRVALRMWRELEDVNPDALLQMMQDAKSKE